MKKLMILILGYMSGAVSIAQLQPTYDQVPIAGKNSFFHQSYDNVHSEELKNGRLKSGYVELRNKGKDQHLLEMDFSKDFELEISFNVKSKQDSRAIILLNGTKISADQNDAKLEGTYKKVAFKDKTTFQKLTFRKLGNLMHLFVNEEYLGNRSFRMAKRQDISSWTMSGAIQHQKSKESAARSIILYAPGTGKMNYDDLRISYITSYKAAYDRDLMASQSNLRSKLVRSTLIGMAFKDQAAIQNSFEEWDKLNDQDPYVKAWLYLLADLLEKGQNGLPALTVKLRKRYQTRQELDSEFRQYLMSEPRKDAESYMMTKVFNYDKSNTFRASFLNDPLEFATVYGLYYLVKNRSTEEIPAWIIESKINADKSGAFGWTMPENVIENTRNKYRQEWLGAHTGALNINNSLDILRNARAYNKESALVLSHHYLENHDVKGLTQVLESLTTEDRSFIFEELNNTSIADGRFDKLSTLILSLGSNVATSHQTPAYYQAFLTNYGATRVVRTPSIPDNLYFPYEHGKVLVGILLEASRAIEHQDKSKTAEKMYEACKCNLGKYVALNKSSGQVYDRHYFEAQTGYAATQLQRHYEQVLSSNLLALRRKACDAAMYLEYPDAYFENGLKWHGLRIQEVAMAFFKYAGRNGHKDGFRYYNWNAENTWSYRKEVVTNTTTTTNIRPSGTYTDVSEDRYAVNKEYFPVKRKSKVDVYLRGFSVPYLVALHNRPRTLFEQIDFDYLSDGAEKTMRDLDKMARGSDKDYREPLPANVKLHQQRMNELMTLFN